MIFTKNDPIKGLVNGSRGIVEAFELTVDQKTDIKYNFPSVRFDNGVVLTITTEPFWQEVELCGLVRR